MIILLGTGLQGLPAHASSTEGDVPAEVRDVAFDTTAVGQLQADAAYDYDRNLQVKELLWDRFKQWLGDQLRKLLGTRVGSVVMDNLEYILLVAALIVLAIFLRRRIFSGVFQGSPHTGRLVRELDEDPSTLDLDALLAEAEQQEDWRGALRFHYLKMLRHLVDEGHIVWEPGNTDRDYLRQLKDPDERSRFGELSFLFRWAWFGDAPMDAVRYRRLAPDFIAFHSPRSTPR